jgi:hypothetical protein
VTSSVCTPAPGRIRLQREVQALAFEKREHRLGRRAALEA